MRTSNFQLIKDSEVVCCYKQTDFGEPQNTKCFALHRRYSPVVENYSIWGVFADKDNRASCRKMSAESWFPGSESQGRALSQPGVAND